MENGWKEIDAETWKFEGKGLPDPLCPSQIDVPQCRNANVRFSVEFDAKPCNYHAALCFRMYDAFHYYVAGLGGWKKQFSFFAHSKEFGNQEWTFGDEGLIKEGRQYEFQLTFRSNRLELFSLLGEEPLPILKDCVFRNAYMSGGLGVYAYGGQTKATIRLLEYKDLGLNAFMVCRIGANAMHVANCERVQRILKEQGINLEIDHSDSIETYPGLMRSITDKMLKADFVISWFPDPPDQLRPNVAYETGIAHALNIPTIHILGRNAKCLPSDLGSQFYVSERDLDRKLTHDVEAILARNISDVRYLI